MKSNHEQQDNHQVANLLKIKNDIPKNVVLNVVCKHHKLEHILPLIQIEHYNFAENYVQEAKEKWQNFNDKNINLKLIGHLQSNKIKDALNLFNEIHSVDSLQKAEKIAKNITSKTKTQKFYAEVNIGLEPQKHGLKPSDITDFLKNSAIEISGLMCLPPVGENSAKYFEEMVKIRKKNEDMLGKKITLSMGMSNDYKEAIMYGSDEIRLGTIILGAR